MHHAVAQAMSVSSGADNQGVHILRHGCLYYLMRHGAACKEEILRSKSFPKAEELRLSEDDKQ